MSQVDEYAQSQKTIVTDEENASLDSQELDFSEFDALAGDVDGIDGIKGNDENEEEGASEYQNVQLDLEDAPFLDDDEEEVESKEEKNEDEGEVKEEGEADAKKSRFAFLANMSKKKKIIIAAGLALFIILIALLIFFLFFSGPSAEVEVAEGEEGSAGTYIVTVDESYKTPPVQENFDVTFEPFWVQMSDEGKTFFLVCTFTLSAENETISSEVKSKIPELRDTIYYYLNTKNYDFLTDYKNFPLIKQDLLDEVNERLGQGELEEIYYDNYIVK